MSKIVFVLGAGASVHSGTPLMNNFLEIAQDLLRRGEVEEVKADFENVFDAVGKLHAAQSKAIIDTYNIEDVYAAFEMGKLLGRLPGIEEAGKLEGLTSSIRKVIGYTLEKTMTLNRQREPDAPAVYYNFTDIIDNLLRRKIDCSIITFNYDLGLDYSMHRRRILPDYCLEDITQKVKTVSYLKLHGSLNWGRCSNKECNKIIPYTKFDLTKYKIDSSYGILPIISKLKNLKCPNCDKPVEEDPFIVPPTWNKTVYHEQIENVWRKAALELKDAEHIFVLGYSFPSNDMFFRYLFALGVDMRTILRGFYVYDIDDSVEGRFKNLLGSGIEQKFHFYQNSFEDAIELEHSIVIPNLHHEDLKTIYEILQIA